MGELADLVDESASPGEVALEGDIFTEGDEVNFVVTADVFAFGVEDRGGVLHGAGWLAMAHEVLLGDVSGDDASILAFGEQAHVDAEVGLLIDEG